MNMSAYNHNHLGYKGNAIIDYSVDSCVSKNKFQGRYTLASNFGYSKFGTAADFVTENLGQQMYVICFKCFKIDLLTLKVVGNSAPDMK